MIGLLIVGGNLLLDKSDPEPSGAEVAAASPNAVSSESSTLLVFNLSSEVEQFRQKRAAEELEKARSKQKRVTAGKEQLTAFRKLPGSVGRGTLESIAECESGGDPRIVSSDGLYHGKYQFSPDTWESVGGKGLPSKAPETEQDYRAALLYERSGPGQWPVCGS